MEVVNTEPQEALELNAMLSWGIWQYRDHLIFNKVVNTLDEVVHRILGILFEYQVVNQSQSVQPPITSYQLWRPQSTGHLKLNIDARKNGEDEWGLGAVIGDSSSHIIAIAVMQIHRGRKIHSVGSDDP